jgi:hypothetical protein
VTRHCSTAVRCGATKLMTRAPCCLLPSDPMRGARVKATDGEQIRTFSGAPAVRFGLSWSIIWDSCPAGVSGWLVPRRPGACRRPFVLVCRGDVADASLEARTARGARRLGVHTAQTPGHARRVLLIQTSPSHSPPGGTVERASGSTSSAWITSARNSVRHPWCVACRPRSQRNGSASVLPAPQGCGLSAVRAPALRVKAQVRMIRDRTETGWPGVRCGETGDHRR